MEQIENFNFECDVEFAKEIEGEEKKTTFKMQAYSGAMVDRGTHKLVVDVEGIQWSEKKRPILLQHDHDIRLGYTTKLSKVDGKLIVEGELMGTSQEAKDAIADGKKGFPWQASIGFDFSKANVLEMQDEKLEVNGIEHEGDFFVITECGIKEISMVSLGADDNTTTEVFKKETDDNKENEIMSEEMKAVDNVVDAGIEEMKAKRVAEIKRCEGIELACKGVEGLAVKHIEAGSSVDLAENEALKLKLAEKEVEAPYVQTTSGKEGNFDAKLTEANVLMSAGFSQEELSKQFSNEVADKAKRVGLQELGYQFARNAGYTGTSFKSNECFSFSTIGGMGNILGNVMNKVLLKSYNDAPSFVSRITAKQDVSDFKQTSQYRLTVDGEYATVSESGELSNASLTADGMYAQADTRGLLITLTRKMWRDDDLGAFVRGIPQGLVRKHILAEKKLCASTILDTAGFWSVGHKNYVEGTGTALSIAGLQKAIETLALQTDASGDPIDLRGSILLVPSALEGTALQLMQSTAITGNAKGDKNVYAGMFDVVSTSYLQAGSATNLSSKAWYLLANPSDAPIATMSYLDGIMAPHLEQVELQGSQLGVQFRCYSDFGCNSSDFRGGVKSKGEA